MPDQLRSGGLGTGDLPCASPAGLIFDRGDVAADVPGRRGVSRLSRDGHVDRLLDRPSADDRLLSAFSPEGVGRSLEAAGAWPAGSYVIRTHQHGISPAGGEDCLWGHAVKGGNGDVWIKPAAEAGEIR
jgi:hypothetical protein